MKHVKRSKKVNEEQWTKDYAGTESSPYSDWLAKQGDFHQTHDANEPAEANPDMLSESEGLYYQEPCKDERIELVKDVWPTLTRRQKAVLQLCGLEGRTLDNCAIMLGVKKGTVQTILNRIQRKFKRLVLQKHSL